MKRWLLKTEPGDYCWDDLLKDGVTVWDGVKNYGALKNMKEMKLDDPLLIYHTGNERAIVGTARVIREAYPDRGRENDKVVLVDIEAGEKLSNPVSLSTIKKSGRFDTWALVKQPRLSVVPVSDRQWAAITRWAEGDSED